MALIKVFLGVHWRIWIHHWKVHDVVCRLHIHILIQHTHNGNPVRIPLHVQGRCLRLHLTAECLPMWATWISGYVVFIWLSDKVKIGVCINTHRHTCHAVAHGHIIFCLWSLQSPTPLPLPRVWCHRKSLHKITQSTFCFIIVDLARHTLCFAAQFVRTATVYM